MLLGLVPIDIMDQTWWGIFMGLTLILNHNVGVHIDSQEEQGGQVFTVPFGAYNKHNNPQAPPGSDLGSALTFFPYEKIVIIQRPGNILAAQSRTIPHSISKVYGKQYCAAYFAHGDIFLRWKRYMALVVSFPLRLLWAATGLLRSAKEDDG